MTNEVLHYLKHDRSFATGLGMYQNMPGANRATVALLSRTGASKNNLEQLHYDMAKLAGINPQLYNRVMAQPVTPAPAQEKEAAAPEAKAPEATTDGSPIDVASLSYAKMKSLVKELGLDVANQKKATLVAALEAHNAQKKS